MARPVGKLVKSGTVIAGRLFEGSPRRQVDTVLRAAVKGAVGLIVRDPRAGVRQDLLACLNCFEFRTLGGRVFRNTINLFRVEDRVDPMDESRFFAGTVGG
jgi:hypothetical protein